MMNKKESKQLEDKQSLMELEMLKLKRQNDKEDHVTLTSIEQEIENDKESWVEKINMFLERLLDKANKEKDMLWHMAFHYLARNKVCKARIRTLKAKLRKALRKRKEHDKLKILPEASLAQHST